MRACEGCWSRRTVCASTVGSTLRANMNGLRKTWCAEERRHGCWHVRHAHVHVLVHIAHAHAHAHVERPLCVRRGLRPTLGASEALMTSGPPMKDQPIRAQ